MAGAAANALPDPVPEAVKEERYARIMEKTESISAAKLVAKVGRTVRVIVDEVGEPDEDGDPAEVDLDAVAGVYRAVLIEILALGQVLSSPKGERARDLLA